MSNTTIQHLKEIGEAMRLKWPELMNFVREQQTLERKEREKQRDKDKLDREKEDERLEKLRQFEIKQKAKEDERKAKDDERLEKTRLSELERAKLELKREERARQKKEEAKQEKEKEKEEARQEKEKERQLESEREEKARRLELEREERARQFELDKQEMERLDLQARLREREARATEVRERQNDGNGDEGSVGKVVGKVPKMPHFDEERDFIDSYLGRFERFAETQKWKREHWAMYLSALLKGRALDVYSRLPSEQAGDYDRLNNALLKRYLLSADGFKKRFRSAKPELGEIPAQFLTRLDNYLERWIELAKVTKSYEELKTLIVQEQYLSTCPKKMAMHLKERKPKTFTELGDVAKNYVEAHATDIVFGLDPIMPKFRSAQSTPRRCYRCGQAGHVSFPCSQKASEERPVAAPKCQGTPYIQQRAGYNQPQVPRTPPRVQRSNQPRSSPRGPASRCFLCNRFGHIARNCLSKPTAAVEFQSQEEAFGQPREEVAACQPRGYAPNYSGGTT